MFASWKKNALAEARTYAFFVKMDFNLHQARQNFSYDHLNENLTLRYQKPFRRHWN